MTDPNDSETANDDGQQDQAPPPSESNKGKGKPFFDRADQVAETGNWDYAIEMYLQGVSREPEDLQRGHHKLREMALHRKAGGGKGAGLLEKRKHKPTKDPIESLVNAEWLMSRDPVGAAPWRQIVEAAKAAGLVEVVRWAGGVLYDINRAAKKPSKDIYLFLTQVFTEIELYTEAVRTSQAALQLDPNNGQLQDTLRDLTARETIQKGQYDQEGDFTKAVKDLKGQLETVQKEQVSQSQSFMADQIAKARVAYEADPTVIGKINALADALTRTDDESFENEAIDVLAKAFNDTSAYRFKMRIGDIKMRQMTRRYQKRLKEGDKEGATELAKEQLAFELVEFADRAANYPTELSIKYELGRRQFIAGQYDDAIATLQQARRDPKHRLSAMSLLGQAFFKKGWHNEAAETFEQALEGELSEQRRKELTYNLGLTREAMGNVAGALEQYSDVAQLDFNYKDVRQRIERLRAKSDGGAETPGPSDP